MAYAYKNLKSPVNVNSGIAEFALLAPADWFALDGIKAPVAPFATQGDAITVKTPHEFITGKSFVKFLLAPQKNELNINVTGDVGFKRQEQEVKIFAAGSYAALHETMQELLNVPLIVLVKDAACRAGLFYQLGNDCQFAYASPAFKSGTTNGGVKGYEVTINFDGGVLLYQVTGGPAVLAD